ncbi:MAG: hypothetical protein AB8F95_21135 [Bacteroidia bacterium]
MLTVRELANRLNRNGGLLLDTIPLESVTTYLELRDAYPNTQVTEDTEFQEKFTKHFGVSGVGVNKEFVARFFEIMDNHKDRDQVDFYLAARAVFGTMEKRKLSPSQFGYLTAMATVINNDNPTYSPEIGKFLRFDPPTQATRDSRDRMNIYLDFYREYRQTLLDLTDDDILKSLLTVFKIKLKQHGDYQLSALKRVDLLILYAAELAKEGKMI